MLFVREVRRYTATSIMKMAKSCLVFIVCREILKERLVLVEYYMETKAYCICM